MNVLWSNKYLKLKFKFTELTNYLTQDKTALNNFYYVNSILRWNKPLLTKNRQQTKNIYREKENNKFQLVKPGTQLSI